jgi:hypothetical protein
MTGLGSPGFGPDAVIKIAHAFEQDDESFVIGGQATNLWAWYFQNKSAALKLAGPFTSQDIDYFGSRSVARNVADRLGGKLYVPGPDDHTPNTAKVVATIDGRTVEIDFMGGLLGIVRRELQSSVSELSVPGTIDGKVAQVIIRVLHPLLCFKSRVINMLHPATLRTDSIARKQLDASLIVMQIHIEEALADGDFKEVKECFRTLNRYLKSDAYVKRADRDLGADGLDIIKAFLEDERLDARYREKQLRMMVAKIERKRANRRPPAAI